jgi:hypothetical protein
MKKAYIQGSITEEIDLSEAFLQLVYELKLNEGEMLEQFVKQGNMTMDSFLSFCQLNSIRIILDFGEDLFQVFYVPLRNLEPATTKENAPENSESIKDEDVF